jgi:hypothetical protein
MKPLLERALSYALLRSGSMSWRTKIFDYSIPRTGSPEFHASISPLGLPRWFFGQELRAQPEGEEIEEIRKRMQALLDSFDYSFSQFTLPGFTRWVEKRRSRQVIFLPYHFLKPRVSGAWLEDERYDYIFFETRDAPPVSQAHSQFHEFSHILCGHSTARVTPEDITLLMSRSGRSSHGQITALFFCDNKPDKDTLKEEMEAEMLSSLMRELILRNSRMEELLKAAPSNMHLLAYFDSLKVS